MNGKKIIKHPLGIIAIALSLVILVALIGTPYVIKSELNKWIVSRGPDSAQSDNVDFNPFTGRFALYNLQVETPRGRTLHIPKVYLQFSWKSLFKKRLYLQEIVLEDTYLLIDTPEDSGFRIAGLILKEVVGATSENKSSPGWGVGIDRFEIINSKIEYDTPQLVATYHIDRYELTDLQSWNKQQPVHLEAQGRINDSPIYINAEVTPFAEQLVTKGKLQLQKAELSLLSKAMAIENLSMEGQFDIDLNVESVRQQDKLINFSTDGSISIQALQVTYNDMEFTDELLSWQGSFSSSKPSGKGLNLAAEGSLASTGHAASLPSQSIAVQTKDLQWQGLVDYDQGDESPFLTMKANLEGNLVAVQDTARNIHLVNLEKFAVNSMDIQSLKEISVAEIILQKLLVLSRTAGEMTAEEVTENSLLQTGEVQVKDIRWQDSRTLAINDITLNGFQAYIKNQKEGGLYLISSPGAATPEKMDEAAGAEPGPASESEPAGSAFQLQIGQLRLADKGTVRFQDETPSQPYLATIEINELQIKNIDMADSSQPVHLKLAGNMGDYTSLSFEGTALPFAKPLSLDIKGKIDAFDMPPLSPYTGQTIGYDITSGQMDAELNMKINKGQFGGKTELRMRNLEVGRVNPDKVPKIDKQMKVPLESGLSMLRNKKGEIKLDIKLEGDIANPQFNFQDAINQAIAKAMTFASISYLKYTLQPFGTFIAVAEIAGKAGKMATKIKLDPVHFGAAEISLDETAKQYLEKVAIILNDRPKLRLEVCGKAVENDRTVLLERRIQAKKDAAQKKGTPVEVAEDDMTVPDEVLQDFAKERAKLVKDTLVKGHGVSHERIYLCLPAIDEAPDKEPYVEMLID